MRIPKISDSVDWSSTPQFQFYAENRLLRHPLVSPALGYLGGLPPLLIIAGNGEVLRDEIVYTLVTFSLEIGITKLTDCHTCHRAHRAAHPEKFPVSEDVRKFYPTFEGIKDKMRATPVHLQIYDGKVFADRFWGVRYSFTPTIDAAHILPNLFPFATPAKFCVRAIISFIRHVTHMPPKTVLMISPLVTTASSSSGSSLARPSIDSSSESGSDGPVHRFSSETAGVRAKAQERYRIVASLSQATTRLRGRSAQIFRFGNEEISVIGPSSRSSSRDDGRCGEGQASESKEPQVVFAGDGAVYEHWVRHHCDSVSLPTADPHLKSGDYKPMIRERVSTQGMIRPLEHEQGLPAFWLSPHLVGFIPEIVLERYMAAKQGADQKFASTIKGIEKARARNVERASRDLVQRATALRRHFGTAGSGSVVSAGGVWRLAWALDADECPPPSSIVGRLDTEEALRFAQAADRRLLVAFTAAAGSEGGQSLSPSLSSWRSAGAAAMVAIWFTSKLQRTTVVAQEDARGAGVSVSRGEVDRSVEVF